MPKKIMLVLVMGVLAGGSVGYAVADQVARESNETSGPSVSASECPGLAASFDRAQLPAPIVAGEECPSPERVDDLLNTMRQVTQDAERLPDLSNTNERGAAR